MEISVKIKNKIFKVKGPMDLEVFWENILSRNNQLDEDKIPYWSELWPSSLILGKYIMSNPHLFKGRRCLDLGCGLGLVSMALRYSKAITLSQDLCFNSLIFCKKNFNTNKIAQPLCIQGDWRYICYKDQVFDFIVGSDILYEKRFHVPIIKFISRTLKKQGIVLISTPKREGTFDFFHIANRFNLSSHMLKKSTVYLSGQRPETFLWELKFT